MRKVFLAGIFSIAAASFVNAQATFGIHVGGTVASQEWKEGSVSLKADSKFGWKVGGVANMPLSEKFAFMPQLNVMAKNSQLDLTDMGGDKTDINLTYIELPLNFVYTSGGFFGGVGPTIGYGVGGKIKSGSDEADVKFDGDNNATDDKFHLKGLDFGGQVIAGYKLPSGLFFNVLYNLSFSNISPDDQGSIKNKYFGFGVGYFFGGGAQASK